MTETCCSSSCSNDRHRADPRYRRVLWTVLVINAAMFAAEIGAGLAAGSASLQADALDFLADASNYGISLFVAGMALRHRAIAAAFKGVTMLVVAVWVLGLTGWHAVHGTLPAAAAMGIVGFVALLANAACFGLLWAFREGDSNMRSAWICTRNDVVGNLAVIAAAFGVFGTGSGWPDLAVASVMAALASQGAVSILRQSAGEIAAPLPVPVPAEVPILVDLRQR